MFGLCRGLGLGGGVLYCWDSSAAASKSEDSGQPAPDGR